MSNARKARWPETPLGDVRPLEFYGIFYAIDFYAIAAAFGGAPKA